MSFVIGAILVIILLAVVLNISHAFDDDSEFLNGKDNK
jgi:hypothetical protein